VVRDQLSTNYRSSQAAEAAASRVRALGASWNGSCLGLSPPPSLRPKLRTRHVAAVTRSSSQRHKKKKGERERGGQDSSLAIPSSPGGGDSRGMRGAMASPSAPTVSTLPARRQFFDYTASTSPTSSTASHVSPPPSGLCPDQAIGENLYEGQAQNPSRGRPRPKRL